MKANLVEFSRLPKAQKVNHLHTFARVLTQQPGLHVFTEDSLVGLQLQAKGIRNVLISEGAKAETVVYQLARVLGLRGQQEVKEVAALFNVPEALAGKGSLLFTQGRVEQTAAAETKYTVITLAEVKAGLTDFGEEMVRFMELNNIESLEILTELTIPRYQRMGFGGAVYGNKLGMRGEVSSWNTVKLRIRALDCIGCFKCVIACPAGAIRPVGDRLTLIADVKKTGWKKGETFHPNRVLIEEPACKGCQLCVKTCDAKPNAVEVIKKDA